MERAAALDRLVVTGTAEHCEDPGFNRNRRAGKHAWIMTTQAPAAGRGTVTWRRQLPQRLPDE